MEFLQQFMAARRVSTPLAAVRTPDPAATINSLTAEIHKPSKDGSVARPPILVWDSVRGMIAGEDGEVSKNAARRLTNNNQETMEGDPVGMLKKVLQLEKQSVVFMLNAHLWLNASVIQALWNLRDYLKQDNRMVVLLCPQIQLPPELSQDILVLDEPLPGVTELAKVVAETYEGAGQKTPDKQMVARCIEAIAGLSAFSAEQVCAMSITPNGMDVDALWERKRQQIEQTPGLSVWRGGERFNDIGGCDNIKTFLSRVLKGQSRPRTIVFIDEIEKALAGAGGDSSGTSQEMLGTLLTEMQDRNSTGLLFIGPPGAAKSAMAKAAGNEATIPTISFDMSGMKGSLVGQSGANMRAALKLVEAVSQGHALYIATCNSIGVLPPELRRRFSFGTFFFDLPSKEERAAIWKIYLAKYELKDTKRPEDTDWTGAEIKQCCDLAYRLETSLLDAATYVVPVAKSAFEKIEELRNGASDRFISASEPGIYNANKTQTAAGGRRSINTDNVN